MIVIKDVNEYQKKGKNKIRHFRDKGASEISFIFAVIKRKVLSCPCMELRELKITLPYSLSGYIHTLHKS